MSEVEEFSREPEMLIKDLLRQPLVLFNPHRMAIMLELYHAGGAEFPQLKRDLNMTDGALATHLKALTAGKLLQSKREEVGPRTRTAFIITQRGIESVEEILTTMCKIKEKLR